MVHWCGQYPPIDPIHIWIHGFIMNSWIQSIHMNSSIYMNSHTWIHILMKSYDHFIHEFIIHVSWEFNLSVYEFILNYDFIYIIHVHTWLHIYKFIYTSSVTHEFIWNDHFNSLISWIWFHEFEFTIWIYYWKQRRIQYSEFKVLNLVVKYAI